MINRTLVDERRTAERNAWYEKCPRRLKRCSTVAQTLLKRCFLLRIFRRSFGHMPSKTSHLRVEHEYDRRRRRLERKLQEKHFERPIILIGSLTDFLQTPATSDRIAKPALAAVPAIILAIILDREIFDTRSSSSSSYTNVHTNMNLFV